MPSDSTPTSGTSAPIAWADPAREQAFQAWLQTQAREHGLVPDTVRSASADASFRRYFRVDGSEAAGNKGSSSWTPHRSTKTASLSCRWRVCWKPVAWPCRTFCRGTSLRASC